MANLSVRKIDDEVYKRLKHRARSHCVSMEAEIRSILQDAVCPHQSITASFAKHFKSVGGIDLDLPTDKSAHEPMSVPDGQIAAICRAHGFSLATRNTKDFANCGITLVNPF